MPIQNIQRIAILFCCLTGLIIGVQWQSSIVRADGPQVRITKPVSADGNALGHVGTNVTITGNGFPGDATVALYTTTNGDPANCNGNSNPATPGLNPFTMTQTGGRGRFTVTAAWPDNASTPATVYYICAISQAQQGQQGQQPTSALSSNTFTIVAAATLDVQPNTVAPGGQITITGTNWLPPQRLILTLTADNNDGQPLRRIMIFPDQQGNFTKTLTIPNNADPQTYTIRVISNDQNTEMTKPLTVSMQAASTAVVPTPTALSSTPTTTTSSPASSITIGGMNGVTLLIFMLGGIGIMLVIVGVIMFFIFAK